MKKMSELGIGGLLTREALSESFGLTSAQIAAAERGGLPVYGFGQARFYDLREVVAFIKERPLRRNAA